MMIKKFNFFLIFIFIFAALTSCGAVKEGFSMQKKDNKDEFLVQKKSPLIMPPDFDELPEPTTNVRSEEEEEENEIKELIVTTKKENTTSDSSKNMSGKLEESLLEKIRNN